jgi:hypothetical protein
MDYILALDLLDICSCVMVSFLFHSFFMHWFHVKYIAIGDGQIFGAPLIIPQNSSVLESTPMGANTRSPNPILPSYINRLYTHHLFSCGVQQLELPKPSMSRSSI